MTTDEQAVQAILQQMEAAWNASDSVGIAALFTEDANFIHLYGGQLDGPTAIEGAHRVIFDTIYKGSQASFILRNIRFVRPDVAVISPNAPGIRGEQGTTRNRDPPDPDRCKRRPELANRGLSKYSNFRCANGSSSCGSACNVG